MSTLHASERGFALPTAAEELTFDRRARKSFELPATSKPARLLILVRSYPGNAQPLRLAFNGSPLEAIRPPAGGAGGYRWISTPIPPSVLRAGRNTLELWVEAEAMNTWALLVDYSVPSSWSEASDDAGTTWSAAHLGYLHLACGEYVIRIRLGEGEDPPPPDFVAEDPAHHRLAALRDRLPAELHGSDDTLLRARRLATWTSTLWRYRNESTAAQYAPWDPATIIAWGQAGSGQDGRVPIVMCVHYAVTYVAACSALGIQARCVVLSEHIDGRFGHFVAEVWVPELGKWVFVDPNEDAIFSRDGVPLSTDEIRRAEEPLAELVEWGPGHAYQARFRSMREWIATAYLTGVCFRYRSIWPRSDFFSHPELTPPTHGWAAYSELDLVWERPPAGDESLAMFRYFAPAAWFDAPPPAASNERAG